MQHPPKRTGTHFYFYFRSPIVSVYVPLLHYAFCCSQQLSVLYAIYFKCFVYTLNYSKSSHQSSNKSRFTQSKRHGVKNSILQTSASRMTGCGSSKGKTHFLRGCVPAGDRSSGDSHDHVAVSDPRALLYVARAHPSCLTPGRKCFARNT